MAISKEIINHMKEMENNFKGYIQKIMDQKEQRINENMEKIFNQLKKQEKEVEEIKASQTFLNQKFEELKTNVEEINSLNIDTKFQNTKKKVIELESKIEKETILRDELEQYGIRDNLEIHGIPVSPNENTNEIIKEVAQKLNVRLLDSDISTFQRILAINGKHLAIIVKFSNRDKRNIIFSNKRNLHGKKDYHISGVTTIYINENLTPRKRNLFARSYKRKVEQNYQYIWTNNEQIYLRITKTDQKIEINNEEDLNKIV